MLRSCLRWVAGAVRRDGYLGAAQIVDALVPGELERLIPDALFNGRRPEAFLPGPYDDLIEQAFREDPELGLDPVPYAICQPAR